MNTAHFKSVVQEILRSGKIQIPSRIEQELDRRGPGARANPYNGYCAQATVAGWVLGKELYGDQFDYKAFHSLDNWHYWLARVPGDATRENALDLTDDGSYDGFDYGARRPATWITRKTNRENLASMRNLKDAVKIYDLAKEKLLAQA
jgi:hypothetical protein